MNIVNLIKNYATPELISSASTLLGESIESTGKGLALSISSILAGILNKSADPIQIGQIWDLINHHDNNSNMLSDLDGLFPGKINLLDADSLGGKLLSALFSNNNQILLNRLEKAAGFKHSGNALKCLSLAAPMILSFLKKKVKTEGYGMSGLSMWLGGQKNEIMALLPADIGIAINPGAKSIISDSTESSFSNEDKRALSWMPWLIAIASLLGFMWFLMKSCNTQKLQDVKVNIEADTSKMIAARMDSMKAASNEVMNKMYVGLDSTVRTKWLALGEIIKINLPDDSVLCIPEKGIESKLIRWLKDSTKLVDKTTWFDFDRILFETGSSDIKEASQEQITNIAKILKAFPKVRIKVGGYTDNVGNTTANKKLSQTRAEAVVKAIATLGIEASRLSAEGYGPDHPVGDNSTSEGRELNRRVSILVKQK